MKKLSAQHWVLIAGFLTATSVQLLTLGDSWEHILHPSFVAGFLGQLGVVVRLVFTDKAGGDGAGDGQ